MTPKDGPMPRPRSPVSQADTGLPPDLRHAGPELVTERTLLWLVIEHGHGHKMIMPSLTTFSRTLYITARERAFWMQTTGLCQVAVRQRSVVRMWMLALSSRGAHGLLYVAAVWDGRPPGPPVGLASTPEPGNKAHKQLARPTRPRRSPTWIIE
jgi:hypothetical protein